MVRVLTILFLIVLLTAAGVGAWEKLVDTSAALTPDPLRGPIDQTAGQLTVAGILRETNREREIHDLPPLRANVKLDQAAQTKVADMFARQYFTHESPDGAGPADLVKRTNYQYIRVGENLALGNFASDADLVEAWMDSPGHRANILHTGFSEIGLAAGRADFAGTEVWLVVQTFAAPLDSCPSVDPTLQQQFDQSKTNLDQLSAQLQNEEAQLNAQQTELTRLEEDLKKLAQAGNDQVSAGNDEIARGNKVYQTTGDRQQAKIHWDRGQQLQSEGQALLEEAPQKQATLEATLADYEKQRSAFNQKVAYQRQQNESISTTLSRLNRQIRGFNDCVK
jgi:hypothetical protein